jgi:hypothetical protein
MTDFKKATHSKEHVWKHSFENALYGLSQGFESACRPKPDLVASRTLYELSLERLKEIFGEVLMAATSKECAEPTQVKE